MKKPSIRQAVILAGGLGTRLRPLTLSTPKPMIPINRRPFLSYIIDSLVKNHIEEIVILTGYLGNQIESYFKDGHSFNTRIIYSNSGVDAGTGLRLKNAYPLLNNKFLLLYGDNYWPFNLNRLYEHITEKKTEALVTVYSNIDNYTKNNIYVNPDGLVEYYDKKHENRKEVNGVDIGFFMLHKKHVALLPTTDSSFEEIVVPYLISKKQLAGFRTHHRYYGLSNKDRIADIKKYFKPKKIVFLDRDGVINKKAPKAEYIKSWEEFELLPDAIKSLQLLTQRKYQIYIVTNQAGITRGKMTYDQVNAIHNKLKKLLGKNSIKIDGIYMCPHGWDEGCFCRKPNPGMFFQAASDHAINLMEASYIGDDERDMLAANRASMKGYLVTNTRHFYDIVRNNFL